MSQVLSSGSSGGKRGPTQYEQDALNKEDAIHVYEPEVFFCFINSM